MTPEEIRAIRESLGLSQVLAGELLGGGPRAFSKYESGSIKPAASVVNLLRLLEVDPAAIETLGGTLPKPISDFSAGPFEVTGQHIEALKEPQLPDLLRRLLLAEAQTHNLPTDGIQVASNIHTGDGGEDGRIEWKDGPKRTPNLPSRLCQFQLKAGAITPSQAGKEVLTKAGGVKEMVHLVLSSGGNYILLCVKPHTEQQILEREDAIRKAVKGAGINIADEQVSFRDADQIASWVNRYPSVATWVKEQTHPGTLGPFRSWSHWNGRGEHRWSPWVEDERLAPLLSRLHSIVSTLRSSVRVVGLTGVGKSRLVLEALGPAATDPDLAAITMYAVEVEAPPGLIIQTVQSLADSGTRAIVVVDECPLEAHRILVGVVSHAGSRLSLITIDHEIPAGSLDESTLLIPEAPLSVNQAIIEREEGLARDDKRRLAQLSSGFPGICLPITRAWATQSPISHATDDHFVDAFVLGRDPVNSESLLKTAALVSAAGVVEFDPVPGRVISSDSSGWPQLDDLAELANNLTKEDLYACVQDLLDRGVLRRRGRLATLEPRPIAMRLAERQWGDWPKDKWDQVLGRNTSSSVKIRAARQLALLNTTARASEVVQWVCRYGGPFEGTVGISKAGHPEILSALAEVDATVVADLLERLLNQTGDLREIRGDLRRQLVTTISKIAFRPDTFELGAELLLRLAVAENESWANNATEQYKALFPILLGNTAASGDSRLVVLDSASDTDDVAQSAIVVEALAHGAQTIHFSRIGNAGAHGTRPSLDSWRPNTEDEAKRYLEGCVRRLAGFAIGDDKLAAIARKHLGFKLRSLVYSGFIDIVEEVCQKLTGQVECWPEGLESLGKVVRFDAKKLNPQLVGRVKDLIASLKPKGVESRLRLIVTEMSWDYPDDEDLDFDIRLQRQTAAVRELAHELVKMPQVLIGHIPGLSRMSVNSASSRVPQRRTADFGSALAELAESPFEWYEPITEALLATPEGERDYGLLIGYVTSFVTASPDAGQGLKQTIAATPGLAPAFPRICLHLGITTSDIANAVEAFESGLVRPFHLGQWTMGGQLAKLPADSVAPLLDAMLERDAESCSVALELMTMYSHDGKDRLEGLRPQIRLALNSTTKWGLNGRVGEWIGNFDDVLLWLLKKGREDEDARAVALELSKALVSSDRFDEMPRSRELMSALLSGFPEIAWPIIGEAVLSSPTKAFTLKFILGDGLSIDHRHQPVILSLPEETLFAWCHANPNSAPIFAAEALPFLTDYDVGSPDTRLHPVMSQLIDQFGNLDDFWRAIDGNIHTGGWSGSATTYYELYRRPLEALQKHDKPKVRTWTRRLLKDLESSIQAARNDDESDAVANI